MVCIPQVVQKQTLSEVGTKKLTGHFGPKTVRN